MEDSCSKKPSNTMCLIVVALLVFILLSGIFIYSAIIHLLRPLHKEAGLIDSPYAQMEIIDQGNEFTILRDNQTDILYLEFKRNGYSSAITVLFNNDGTPKTYSQYLIDG